VGAWSQRLAGDSRPLELSQRSGVSDDEFRPALRITFFFLSLSSFPSFPSTRHISRRMLTPTNSSRRSLLRSALGDWLERLMAQTEERVVTRRYVRPPGSLPELGFLAACTRCGACIDACPPHALAAVPTDGGLAAGTPYLDLMTEPCIACSTIPCATACPTPALTFPEQGWSGHRLATLELYPERCLTFHGTACRICVDACPIGEAALGLDPAGHPVLRHEGCVGCGVCLHACPTAPSSFALTFTEH
jgi:ferredoxin-type protein NapG